VVLEKHWSADRRQQKERQADREEKEQALSSRDTEIEHLDVDVAVVLVTIVVMVVVRALDSAVEAVVIDMRVYAAQLRPNEGATNDQ
jgi:hypothetical protein